MKRALVIEDNVDNMVLMTRLLQKAGYETIEAETGRDGFEKALAERPDFILLDIQLPDIIGTEVLKMIRESKIGHSIPVIAITSYAMTGDKEKLLAAGCDGYIEKPVDHQKVISQIKKIVGDD